MSQTRKHDFSFGSGKAIRKVNDVIRPHPWNYEKHAQPSLQKKQRLLYVAAPVNLHEFGDFYKASGTALGRPADATL